MVFSAYDQWGILLGILLISLIITYVAFRELPNEDIPRMTDNPESKK
jgi:hypothetical protein